MLRRLGRFTPAIALLLAAPCASAGPDNTGSPWVVAPPHQTLNTGWGDCTSAPPATAITCEVNASHSSLDVSYRVSNAWSCPLPAGTIQVTLCAATPGSALAPNCRALNQITVSPAAPFAAGADRDFTQPNPFQGVQESCSAREGN